MLLSDCALTMHSKAENLNLKIQNNILMSDRLMTRKDVCELYGISLMTLHTLTKNGTIRGFKLGGKVLYKEADVLAALKEIPFKPKPEVHA